LPLRFRRRGASTRSSPPPPTPPRKRARKQAEATKSKEAAEGRCGLAGEGGGCRRPGSMAGRAPRAATVRRFESTRAVEEGGNRLEPADASVLAASARAEEAAGGPNLASLHRGPRTLDPAPSACAEGREWRRWPAGMKEVAGIVEVWRRLDKARRRWGG
jgi:hypothetical protein